MSREYKLRLRIAGLNIKISSSIPLENLLLRDNLYLFREDSAEKNYSISINIDRISQVHDLPGKVIYDPGDMWKLYKNGNEVSAVLFDYKNRPKCIIKPSEKWDINDICIKIYGDEDRSIVDSGSLELIFRTSLIQNNGVIIHSSLVDYKGKGILFAGNSGDGKSTQSSFWKEIDGAEIINEDRNAVRITEEGIYGYGTPWGGTMRKVLNNMVKLNAIILITKSKSNHIERLQPEKSLPLLISRTFFPYWDKELAGKAADILKSITFEIPVYMLYCKPEKETVNLIKEIL